MIPPRATVSHPKNENVVVVVDGDAFRVFNTKENTFQTPTLPPFAPAEVNKDHQQEKSAVIIGAVFSADGNHFCTASQAKEIRFFDTDTWVQTASAKLPKRPTCVAFMHSSVAVAVADREGDVHVVSVTDGVCAQETVMESLALIFDVTPTSDNKYMISGDRHGKLRVSHYPNGYNIRSFCLGHSDMVTRVMCVRAGDRDATEWVVSGSADGTVKVWDYLTGTVVGCTSTLDKDLQSNGVVNHITTTTADNGDTLLSFSYEGKPHVYTTTITAVGSLRALYSIPAPANVCGVSAGSDNRLWIITENEGTPVSMAVRDANRYTLVTDATPDHSATLQHINANVEFGDIREDPPKWSTFLHPDPEKSKGRTTADYYEKKAGRVSATMERKMHKTEAKAKARETLAAKRKAEVGEKAVEMDKKQKSEVDDS